MASRGVAIHHSRFPQHLAVPSDICRQRLALGGRICYRGTIVRRARMSASPKPAAAAATPDLFATPLAASDPEIAEAIRLELGRQRGEIELIASENIVSRAVLEAQGSVLTNHYAEGLPG